MVADFFRERRQNLLCLAIGILLNGLTVGLCFLVAYILTRFAPAAPPAAAPPPNPYTVAAVIAAVICTLMLVIAIFTKPASRAEVARMVLDSADYSAPDDRAEAHAASLLAIIALYGSYALVEGGKRLAMQISVATALRDRLDRILMKLVGSPNGLTGAGLPEPGEPMQTLRAPVAALILYDWVKVVDDGTTLTYVSAAMRRLHRRHPLADVFQTVG